MLRYCAQLHLYRESRSRQFWGDDQPSTFMDIHVRHNSLIIDIRSDSTMWIDMYLSKRRIDRSQFRLNRNYSWYLPTNQVRVFFKWFSETWCVASQPDSQAMREELDLPRHFPWIWLYQSTTSAQSLFIWLELRRILENASLQISLG